MKCRVLSLICLLRISNVSGFAIRPSHTVQLHYRTLENKQCMKSLQATADGDDKESNDKEKKKIVVIGGGWAGYTVCESLSTNENTDIILLDAAAKPNGGLAGGFRDEKNNNRPVEAGIHGFWREYKNTFAIMDDIEGVNVDDVLSDYTPSVLFSKNGRVALAPVLGKEEDDNGNLATTIQNINPASLDSIRKGIAANLPPPLDVPLLAEFDPNSESRLTPLDLVSAIGLLGAWADFEQESPTSWERYDKLPATELFQKAGITKAVYEELVSPLLHVLPMCPAYDCSAAAALSCFHVFALQSRGAFDVRWCSGSISEKIFEPWQVQLETRGVQVRGGARVTSIEKENIDKKGKYTLTLMEDETIDCDAVVLAVGATSMGKIAASSKVISSLEQAKDFDKLRGVTCVAVRLFLKPHSTITSGLGGGLHDKTQLPPDLARAMKDSPIAVCGAEVGDISELKETGFCIYDLQRMHSEFSVDEYSSAGISDEEQVAVLEVDYYRADDIANMNDDEIASLALKTVAAAFGTSIIDEKNIMDKAVIRARNAVSHFCPNSAIYSPSVKLDDGLYVCGDWVDRCGHASWSTEKSVVTARQAAASVSQDLGFTESKCDVIPAAKDTAQLGALRQSARLLRKVAPPLTVPPSPWVLAKQLLSGERAI